MNKRRQGPRFTLWQLLATVTVVAVVLGVATPLVRWLGEQDRETVVAAYAIFHALLFGAILGLGIAALYSRSTAKATVYHVLSRGVGVFCYFAMMIEMVPAFERIFADFDAKLPTVTKLVMIAAYTTVRYWFLLIPLAGVLVAIDAGVFCCLYRTKTSRGWAKLWSGIVTALLVGGIVLTFFALMRPLFVVTSLSPPP